MGASDSYSSENKVKLYSAMESDDGSDPNRSLDKGKGVDRDHYDDGNGSDANSLDKGKGIDKTVHPLYAGTNVGQATEPPFVV